jgi:hypothetical protein
MPGQTQGVVLVGERRHLLFGSALRLRLIGRFPLHIGHRIEPSMFQRLDVSRRMGGANAFGWRGT